MFEKLKVLEEFSVNLLYFAGIFYKFVENICNFYLLILFLLFIIMYKKYGFF